MGYGEKVKTSNIRLECLRFAHRTANPLRDLAAAQPARYMAR